jgi:putative tricarboxylic transport membrane protein
MRCHGKVHSQRLFGWLLKATGFPRAPFLIGFVLAIPLERCYFLTDSLYDGFDWLLRPWVFVFLVILVAPAALGVVRAVRARRGLDHDDDQRRPPAAGEARRADSLWSLLTSVGALVVFGLGWLAAGPLSAEARLVPRLICGAGVLVGGRTWCAVLVLNQVSVRLPSSL